MPNKPLITCYIPFFSFLFFPASPHAAYHFPFIPHIHHYICDSQHPSLEAEEFSSLYPLTFSVTFSLIQTNDFVSCIVPEIKSVRVHLSLFLSYYCTLAAPASTGLPIRRNASVSTILYIHSHFSIHVLPPAMISVSLIWVCLRRPDRSKPRTGNANNLLTF